MVATDYILKVISLLGGLALFLFGMDIMGKALQKQAGGKLQTLLARMSSTWWKGLLLGTCVTAVIQSSSATTVMLVGFVNSGLMALEQTLASYDAAEKQVVELLLLNYPKPDIAAMLGIDMDVLCERITGIQHKTASVLMAA